MCFGQLVQFPLNGSYIRQLALYCKTVESDGWRLCFNFVCLLSQHIQHKGKTRYSIISLDAATQTESPNDGSQQVAGTERIYEKSNGAVIKLVPTMKFLRALSVKWTGSLTRFVRNDTLILKFVSRLFEQPMFALLRKKLYNIYCKNIKWPYKRFVLCVAF